VLANVIGKSYASLFREFEGDVDPFSVQGSGDVKYHLGCEGSHRTPEGEVVEVLLASNPSHLESVDPVVEGMARARQDLAGAGAADRILPLLLHGDAAFAGQGVVAETLNMSQLAGYRTGGTIHIVINNQIGFTTRPEDARSTRYATDVAKAIGAPIFHANGNHPEACVRVVRLALAYRQAFGRDAVIDLVCYRRWGHNEADDPAYTEPRMYRRIEEMTSVREQYADELLRRGDIDDETAASLMEDFRERLERVFDDVRAAVEDAPVPDAPPDLEPVKGAVRPHLETGVPRARLASVLARLDDVPDDFRVHPKLAGQLARRRERFEEGVVDWGLAEALAFGSLLLEGVAVRLTGQDSGRGTFSQRHAVLYDFESGATFVPLAHLAPDQSPFHVYDSLLSEFAVLGFEYGYSVERPEALVIWEAQFGDFANGAQVVIDQYVAAAEEKWGQQSRLVMLLPHGYEGQGPEHSSARLERFLQLAAEGNIQVAYPSSAAQYFHLLRRQVLRDERKPLVVMTPKSLLRLPAAASTPEHLAAGRFHEILDDPSAAAPADVRRLVLCTGKLYYELVALRDAEQVAGVAVVRIEQFYPYPGDQLAALLDRYAAAAEVVWAQEEPRNMGAWDFLKGPLRAALAPDRRLAYVGRPRSASPATGSHRRHEAAQEDLVRRALGLAS
jgi:2-oxoglutarate dehydrogenase E1 component